MSLRNPYPFGRPKVKALELLGLLQLCDIQLVNTRYKAILQLCYREIDAMEEQPDQTEPAAARQAQTQVMVNRTYPVPPYYYKAFTDAAWKAHKAQQTQAADQERGQIGGSSGAASRAEGVDGKPWNPFASGDQDDLSSRTRVLFEPPRVDWMIESGYWEAFGTSHAVSFVALRVLSRRL
jgi:hypothetical protein